MADSGNGVSQHTRNAEDRMYRSSLKQIVSFLNTTLPPLEDSESVDRTEKKIKKLKDKPDENAELGSYLVKDVTPTRVPGKPSESKTKKKRINAFSERKYNDIRADGKLRQGKRHVPKKEAHSHGI